VAAVTPAPTYNGEDDLEIFMKWLQSYLTFLDIHRLVGRDSDYERILTLRATLAGPACDWYEVEILKEDGRHRTSFEEMMLNLSDEFLTPASATKAQSSFDRVRYSKSRGIRAYTRELQTLSAHLFMKVDEYTLRRHIINAIPQSICNWLIELKGLSTSTSSVAEWITAIEQRERELLEKEAYSYNTTKLSASSTTRPTRMRETNVPTKDTSRTPRPSRSREGQKPSSSILPTGPKVPIADRTCYACGQKGHLRGSKECPRTTNSARIHEMGAEAEIHQQTPETSDSGEESHFDGEEYLGDTDQGPREEETSDDGVGVALAGLHVEEYDAIEEDQVIFMATTTRAESHEDAAIANELLKTVAADYEIRGSEVKPRPTGKTAKQLKDNSQREWASNTNVNLIKDERPPQTNRLGLPALIKVNGVDAYTGWDTGSELDAISPDFVRALGIDSKAKETPLRIRLGTKGSSSRTSYEVKPILGIGNPTKEYPLDVVNLDRYDLILGNPFCNKFKVVLDYKDRSIRFGDTVIWALSNDDDTAIRKKGLKTHLASSSQ
jgi:hypothetical protein